MRDRFVEQLRHAPAGREVRDELEPIRVRAIEPAQVHVRGMTDRGEARHALGQGRYESRMFNEPGRKIEALDLIPGFGVNPVRSRAESVNCERKRGVCHREHSEYRLQRAFRKPGLW